MKRIIGKYIELMNKYILVKLITVMLILAILLQILTVINKVINSDNINENPKYEYNTYKILNLSIKDISERYFLEYKSLLLYDIDEAFQLLESEFKNNFSAPENFENYIKNVDIENIEMKDYSMTKENDEKKYLVTDNFNNTYTFIVKEANIYKVILKLQKEI